jgi:hypothetical protein
MSPNGFGGFRPTGTRHVGQDLLENPTTWESGKTIYSARIFVGFKVGNKTRWSVKDLIRVMKAIRKRQGRRPDSSFIAQEGLYTSSRTGETIDEKGAQVMIINMVKLSLKEFTDEMIELAEEIARQLKQEEVVLQVQKNGMDYRTWGISPS